MVVRIRQSKRQHNQSPKPAASFSAMWTKRSVIVYAAE